jgi:hypothetical protein
MSDLPVSDWGLPLSMPIQPAPRTSSRISIAIISIALGLAYKCHGDRDPSQDDAYGIIYQHTFPLAESHGQKTMVEVRFVGSEYGSSIISLSTIA